MAPSQRTALAAADAHAFGVANSADLEPATLSATVTGPLTGAPRAFATNTAEQLGSHKSAAAATAATRRSAAGFTAPFVNRGAMGRVVPVLL
mmetsp:Transcript_16378/g.22153  ORF Transcript_16378/g.22153 Transcript_16378/m.22153 type:complete len:92 (+) Transcript_16378:737-1012(+)